MNYSGRSALADVQRVRRDDSVEVRVVGIRFGGASRYRIDPKTENHRRLIGKPLGAVVSVACGGEELPGTIVRSGPARPKVPPIAEAASRLN